MLTLQKSDLIDSRFGQENLSGYEQSRPVKSSDAEGNTTYTIKLGDLISGQSISLPFKFAFKNNLDAGTQATLALEAYAAVDGKVSYTFTTDRRGADRYNKFITDAQKEGRLDTGTNIMFTGGVGGTISEVLYPDDSLNEAKSTIDWIRVFVKDDTFTNVNDTLTKTTFKIPGSMRTQAYFLQNGKKVYSVDVEHKTDEKPTEPQVYIERNAKIKHTGFWEDTHVARFERFIPVNYIIPVEFRDQAYFIQDGKKVHTYHQQIPVGTTYRQAGIPQVQFTENSRLRFVSYNWQRWDEKLSTNIGGRGITARLDYR